MKHAITILFFFVLSHLCSATEKVKLPEEPWRALVFMEKDYQVKRWEGNIPVKLLGNYSLTDSLMIVSSIKVLNELCETVELSITTHDRGNLEIFFLDSTNEKTYESIIVLQKGQGSTWSYSTNIYGSVTSPMHFNLAICRELVPEGYRQNFFTNKLAYALYPKYLPSMYAFKNGLQIKNKPISIFDPWKIDATDTIDYSFLKLSKFDQQLIQAVYAPNFAELLPLAKKQFEGFEFPEWLRENSYSILIFPFVVALFLLTGLFILFYRKLGIRIKNRLLQFNVISVLVLLTLGLLASFYYVAASQLKDPYFNHFDIRDFFQISDISGAILTFLILGLPALNIIRIIELVIHRKTEHKYVKTLLLFSSTSLLPSITLLSIIYFSSKKDINEEGIRAMILIFLGFVFIGIIRALISFFILKEKEIKIENEVKLANLRELKTRAELNALHSKINPHFLYNSLNSIAGLAKTNAEKTEHMALSLSKLFRYSINKEQSDWSTLADELEMVNVYLDIEKVRFDDRLEFSIDLPEELKSVRIPQFLIQPLVENALKHGISKLVTKGNVKITVRKVDPWIEIEVADNGSGFPAELNPGFGLQSIYDKLEILYPDRFELHFLNSPNKHILIKLA